MKKQALIDHWVKSADEDLTTMRHLFQTRDYAWSLFVGHLVIEKLLKAYYIKIVGPDFPFTHNLLKLADKAGLNLTPEQQILFAEITEFNIETRYWDYKRKFYRKCTRNFATNYIVKIQELQQWLKKIIAD